MHSTSNLEDGYIGSGKRLWYSIKKYGRENFKIEILEFVENRSSLKLREKELVNESLLLDPLCMNLQLGGGGGFANEDHMKKAQSKGGSSTFRLLNERHLDKLKNDSEYKLKYSESLSISFSGEKNGFYGKSHKQETRDKIGESVKISQKGEKNSQFGSCWITNEIENKKIKKESLIPNGWKLGRKQNSTKNF